MNAHDRKAKQTAKAIALAKPNLYRHNGLWTVAEFHPDSANVEGYKVADKRNGEAFYWTLKQPMEIIV